MSNNLTDGAENRVLDWLTTNATTAPTGPLKAALMTANGSDSTPGTEVAGGGYARQTIAFPAAAGSSAANTALITFTNMPACTVVGIEIYDSAGTPFRWWWGPLTSSKVVNAGDDFQFAIGAVVLSMD